MESQLLVYVLILNYCSLNDTRCCVDSVKSSEYTNLRLLVIDNASPDGSGDALSQYVQADEFLRLPLNTGYAGGNNAGMRIAMDAGAEFVLILNPDVRLPPNAVSEYVKLMMADESIAAVNPIQLCKDKCTIDPFFRREMFDSNGYTAPEFPVMNPQQWDVMRLFGAALFLRRQTIRKVGGFDPLFFAYWEEVDLCRRIKHHGGRLCVTSLAPVVHLRTYAETVESRFRAFLRLKGMYLYQLKDFSKPLAPLIVRTLYELCVHVFVPPYSEFGWRRTEYLRTIGWCLSHLIAIHAHRERDKLGQAYL